MKSRLLRTIGVIALSFALVAAVALVGCASKNAQTTDTVQQSEAAKASEPAVELSIYAANSLQKALPEVQKLYTEQFSNVTFADTQFEASGTLVTKLKEDNSKADILICASKKTMDNAVSNLSVDEASRFDMFANDLVICAATNSGVKVTSINDLTSDAITSIAIGEPNVVPAGKYAIQALKSANLVTYDEAEDGTISNVVYADSIASKINAGADKVGTVASYVKEGTCQVGFVYTSDIYRYEGISAIYTTPADSHKTIVYPGAISVGSKNAQAAADFLSFCTTDPAAVKIFSEYGFEVK